MGSLVRDTGALTLFANSEAEAAVLHMSHPLQSVQHANHICLWVVHHHLRRQYHARGNILYVSGPLGQTVPQQVNCCRPS